MTDLVLQVTVTLLAALLLLLRLEDIHCKLDKLFAQGVKIMADVATALNDLETQTAAIDGAEDSAEAAFTRLAQMIADLKTSSTDPATAARIQAAADALRARAAKLAAAVAATPA